MSNARLGPSRERIPGGCASGETLSIETNTIATKLRMGSRDTAKHSSSREVVE